MARVQLFLSTVSAEFLSYRDRLRQRLTRPNVEVKVQEDFIVTGNETLEMLDEYIKGCDGVIHLVGDMTGSPAKAPSLAAIKQCYPDLATRLPLADFLQPEGPSLPYTQWEAWLALLHKKKLFIATPTPEAARDAGCLQDPAQQALQQAHLKRLRAVSRYPGVAFTGQEHLAAEVLRSFVLDLLVEAGLSKRPQTLPYASLGSLFKGRQALLNAIETGLGPIAEQAGAVAPVVALVGQGGVGKSRLAIEQAWRQLGRHCAVLFVLADSPAALERNLAGLCGERGLDLSEKALTEQAAQAQAVLNWLVTHPGWLLILDNVDNEAAATAVESLLSQLSGGQVLITTRLRNWSGSVQVLDVDILAPDDAAAFLLERTEGKRRLSEDDIATALLIGEDLGYLALALEQAGAYISQRRLSFAGYRSEWQQRRTKVLAWNEPRLTQYPASLAITWLTSFEQLGEETRTMLRRLAWLSPAPIPESLLEVPINGEAANPGSAFDALVELEGLSLLNRSGEAPYFMVHRLVQAVTRLRQEMAQEPHELAAALAWINAAFVANPQDVRSWPVLEPLEPHAKAVAGFADQAGLSDPTARLFHEMGVLFDAKAAYSDAEPLKRRVVEIFEASYGNEHPILATALNNLAQLLQDTNRVAEAEPLMRRALQIDEASYGLDHPNVAISLNNRAALLRVTNRLAEAEPLMRRALQIDEASYGLDHPNVATRLNNLAGLLRATNRLAEAEPMYRRALQIDEASYGLDHPEVATDLNNLAQLLQATNRLAEAEPLMRRALAIDEASYGLDHPKVAIGLNNLAGLLQATNRLAEAEPLMRRALQIDEGSYGLDHPNVARDLNSLAGLLKDTNRLAEAEPLMRRALQIDEDSYGLDHPRVATKLNNLAQLFMATNQLAEAEPLMRRALAIDEASYGLDHPEVATKLNNLAQLFVATNRLAEAEPMHRRALQIDEASYGLDHPKVAIDLTHLARLLDSTNRLAEAEPMYRRALAINEASYGLDHPRVALILNNLAALLQVTNRLAEAEPLMLGAFVIFLASLGLDHPNTQIALKNYTTILQDQGLSEEAIQAKLASLHQQD